MTNEKALTRELRKKLGAMGVFFQTLESAMVPALPDLYAVGGGLPPTFIEAKWVKSLQCKLPFRPGQCSWLRENVEAGGNSLVVAWVDDIKAILVMGGVTAAVHERSKLCQIEVPTRSLIFGKDWHEVLLEMKELI